MYYLIILRADSCGPIHQETIEHYEEAKARFDILRKHWFFCKLCIVIEEN